MRRLARSRTFITVVVGSIVGILGVTGWHGFLYHIGTQLLVRLLGCCPSLHQLRAASAACATVGSMRTPV